MAQMNIKLTELIFSDYPNLTLSIDDLTSEVATLTWEGEATNRLSGAMSSIRSPRFFVVGSISAKISKESPRALEFWKQFKKNTILTGTATFNADVEDLEGSLTKLDLMVGEVNGDGNNPALEVIIRGDLAINKDLAV